MVDGGNMLRLKPKNIFIMDIRWYPRCGTIYHFQPKYRIHPRSDIYILEKTQFMNSI